jgi:subtilase family serine protease
MLTARSSTLAAKAVPASVRLVPTAIESSSAATATPPTTARCRTQSAGAYACYQPSQLRVAYDVGPLYAKGIEGQHETIAIVDAFGSPTITSDLRAFDTAFGLPAPPSLKIIQPAGTVPAYRPSGRDRVGWAAETSLDVEWAHALAPKASILLVETPTDEVEGTSGFPDIVKAENYVVAHKLASVISQSFAATEETFSSVAQLAPLRSAFIAAQRAGVTVLAGSGDLGATDYESNASTVYPTRVTSWPSSDPLVTAVGGTKLDLNAAGHAIAPAVAWNDTYEHATPIPSASGGGHSKFFARPGYQRVVAGIAGARRAVPDVSMSAACSGFVEVYQGFAGVVPGWHLMCGTSEATPLFAAIVALADQEAGHGLGLLNPALYGLLGTTSSGIVDVTSGNNTVAFRASATTTVTVKGFNSGRGYDLVSGVGTVNAASFVPALVREARHLAVG